MKKTRNNMIFRQATYADLPALKSAFAAITKKMNENGFLFWDDRYPYEVFSTDIAEERLYLWIDHDTIVSAFALCEHSSGEKAVAWEAPEATALYLYRFAVHPDYEGRGIAKAMLQKVREVSRTKGADYLRLFVVDSNLPALSLYAADGFSRVEGINVEQINDGPKLIEYGFEVKL